MFRIVQLLALIACRLLHRAVAAETSPAPRLNVVIFLMDDLGWRNSG
jgi:hypothetical protein